MHRRWRCWSPASIPPMIRKSVANQPRPGSSTCNKLLCERVHADRRFFFISASWNERQEGQLGKIKCVESK
jgi:hypothetical protein